MYLKMHFFNLHTRLIIWLEIESSLVENNDSWCWASSHMLIILNCFMNLILMSYLRNPYLHHDHKDFLLYFLFKFLCFMFHIKLILTNAMRYRRYGLKFFLCMYVCMGSQLFHYSLLKTYCCSLSCLCIFVENQLFIYMCVCLFLVPPFCSVCLYLSWCRYLTVLIIVAF